MILYYCRKLIARNTCLFIIFYFSLQSSCTLYMLFPFSNFICCSMEFLYRTGVGDAPLVAFVASDGVIRVLSMMTWKVGT